MECNTQFRDSQRPCDFDASVECKKSGTNNKIPLKMTNVFSQLCHHHVLKVTSLETIQLVSCNIVMLVHGKVSVQTTGLTVMLLWLVIS